MGETDQRLLLSTSRVADLLGIHSSTVKRWSDEGSFPSQKTGGGHRRFRLSDILRGARARGIETFLDPFEPWGANVWLAFHDAAVRDDWRRAINLAFRWLADGEVELLGRFLYSLGNHQEIPFPRFLDHGVRGFMSSVGEAWLEGRLQIGEEHMATQVVHEVLIRLRKGWDLAEVPTPKSEDPRPVAIVGAMEGDQHDLGSQAIRVLLERAGWRVYFLGANVPIEDFARIQGAQLADLVCISFAPSHAAPDVQRAIRVLSEFYRHRTPYALALGGKLAGDQDVAMPDGPFESVSLSHSAEGFMAWLEENFGSKDPASGRRVA